MAILKSTDLSPDEERQQIIGDSIIGGLPEMLGVKPVRGMSPLVMTALQRANNPYVTGRRGFLAIGIEYDGEVQLTCDAEFGIALMPKTAEVIILWTCDREELKQFATHPQALQDAALEYMSQDSVSTKQMAEATIYIAEQLVGLSKARANPEEKKAPESAALKEGGNGPKKLARTGSRKF